MTTLTKVNKALEFATKAHEGQKRKVSGLPYIVHPTAVANTVKNMFDIYNGKGFEIGGELVFQSSPQKDIEAVICAAYLHDVVEDCGIPIDTIEEEFGTEIAKLVYELTELTSEINDTIVAQLRRHEKWLLNKTKIKNMSEGAAIVKLADRLDNCSIFVDGAIGWAEKYYDETVELVSILHGKYGGFGRSFIINHLAKEIRAKLCEFNVRLEKEGGI